MADYINNNINVTKLIDATGDIARKASTIAGTRHGSAWLFDKLMRYFESEPAADAVTIPFTSWNTNFSEVTITRHGEVTYK